MPRAPAARKATAKPSAARVTAATASKKRRDADALAVNDAGGGSSEGDDQGDDLHADHAPAAAAAAPGLSVYELTRQRRISDNNAVLAGLGLDAATASMASLRGVGGGGGGAVAQHIKSHGLKPAPRKRVKLEPSRRSLRVQGKGADGQELPDRSLQE
jgi:hypothetical protein